MTAAMIINDVTIAILIFTVFYLIKGLRSLSRTARRQSLELDGCRLANEVVTDALVMMEPRLRRVEGLVKNTCEHAEMNRQGLERLGERIAELEPWGQGNGDQVDDDDLADEAEEELVAPFPTGNREGGVLIATMITCTNHHPLLITAAEERPAVCDCGASYPARQPAKDDQAEDDDSTGDDLSDVPFTVIEALPPVAGYLRGLADALPALTSSYSVVCPACETVNRSEGVPPVQCEGCKAELPQREWPF
jgi:hypothetical protein